MKKCCTCHSTIRLNSYNTGPRVGALEVYCYKAGNKARRKRGRKREITRILQSRVTQAFKRRLREDSARNALEFSKRCRVVVRVVTAGQQLHCV
ncbi:hypothetical protein JG688_00008202 [Phytophthora aleatoria]|uniref:Uncharacterized protein n=1 Tax=Phytophthora aleatoria TaxID=2496075 RepID=A0A8J5IRC7_9STRA|nr:hypothetical protein JG688_00008202 [Phytophthora aleatoria]